MLKKTKILSKQMMTPLWSKKQLSETAKAAVEGSIPAKLLVITHNQRIINEKLNKLLKK